MQHNSLILVNTGSLHIYQDNSIDLIISRILRDVNIYIFSVLIRGGDSAILIIQ